MSNNRNADCLASFTRYCQQHPEQRFWQALRNWCGYTYLYATNTQAKDEGDGWDHRLNYREICRKLQNTFRWKGRTGDE